MSTRPAPTASAFGRYWIAAAISSWGTAVTSVALPVLVIDGLRASPVQVAVVNAAQLVPYAVLGIVAGAWLDRWPRRPVLVWASVGRGLCLALVPALFLAGHLTVGVLVAALLGFGASAVFGFAATQSLLPSLVPRERLVVAHARLDQTDATAMTLGPALAGVLVRVLGAPLALLVDAASYLGEAVLVATIRVAEQRPRAARRHVLVEVREGLAWTYRHPLLGRLALSTHVWFVANGAAATTLPWLALRTLHLGSLRYSLLLAVLGVTTLLGATLAPGLGARWGAGRLVLGARALYPVAWLLLVGAVAAWGQPALFVAQGVLGLAAGLENPNEMALWQTWTPDRLLGRVNGSRRSVNRTLGALGAVLGGLAVGQAGVGVASASVAAVFGIAALLVAPHRVRAARVDA